MKIITVKLERISVMTTLEIALNREAKYLHLLNYTLTPSIDEGVNSTSHIFICFIFPLGFG